MRRIDNYCRHHNVAPVNEREACQNADDDDAGYHYRGPHQSGSAQSAVFQPGHDLSRAKFKQNCLRPKPLGVPVRFAVPLFGFPGSGHCRQIICGYSSHQ